jgi:hypothetical protein
MRLSNFNAVSAMRSFFILLVRFKMLLFFKNQNKHLERNCEISKNHIKYLSTVYVILK